MKIKFLGAAGTVTGSSYVLTSQRGSSILIDLGMFQGEPDIQRLNYEPFDFDCSTLSGAILTHAHLDHCGRIPILLTGGYRGDILMTPPTRELTELSLLDSAKVARNDGKPMLYDQDLVRQTAERFRTCGYHQAQEVGDFSVTFVNAGHILGSASLIIEDRSAAGDIRTIVFSGDLGNFPEPLQEATEFIDTADAVVMESTYGDRLHPEGNASDAVANEISEIESNNGTLLIPAFSLERTQELLHMILHLKNSTRISYKTSVYLDSPMAQKATDIYGHYPKLFNAGVRKEFESGGPFSFPHLTVVDTRTENQEMYSHKGAKVIIAGSGMMTGGRIVGLAAHFLPIPTTRLLIVGYQGEETLGRAIMEGQKEVIIDGVRVRIKAQVNNTQTMSSHADQGQLMQWFSHIEGVKKVFLTHGDDGPRAALSEKIRSETGISDVTIPTMLQEVEL